VNPKTRLFIFKKWARHLRLQKQLPNYPILRIWKHAPSAKLQNKQ